MESSFNLLGFLWFWFKIAMFTIGCANLTTIFTPTNHKKPFFQGVLDVLNAVSLNVFKNENKDEARP